MCIIPYELIYYTKLVTDMYRRKELNNIGKTIAQALLEEGEERGRAK